MFTLSETSILAAILLVALGILGWGFYRARPFGKLGILAWLQSVVLMTPWLLFFGLFAAGIYINIAGILFLVVTHHPYTPIFSPSKKRNQSQWHIYLNH